MKSLSQYVNESIDSSIVRDKALKFTALAKLLDKMGVPTTRSLRKNAQESIKKFLGKGPYYLFRSDHKLTSDALKEIASKANVSGKGFTDVIDINKGYKDIKDKGEDSISTDGYKKFWIEQALKNNKWLKEKGFTNDMDTLLKRMNDLLEKDPIKLDRSYEVATSSGHLEKSVNFFPGACVVDDKLVPVLQTYNPSAWIKDKTIMYVFSEDTLKSGVKA